MAYVCNGFGVGVILGETVSRTGVLLTPSAPVLNYLVECGRTSSARVEHWSEKGASHGVVGCIRQQQLTAARTHSSPAAIIGAGVVAVRVVVSRSGARRF